MRAPLGAVMAAQPSGHDPRPGIAGRWGIATAGAASAAMRMDRARNFIVRMDGLISFCSMQRMCGSGVWDG
jgi:hypothetical protein